MSSKARPSGRVRVAARLAVGMMLLTLGSGCGQTEASLLGAGESWPQMAQDRELASRRAAFIRSQQQRASAAYAFAERGEGRLRARNQAQGFEVELGANGPRVRSASWSLELRLARFGRTRGLEPVLSVPTRDAATARGRRASLRHGAGLEEWYLNGPLGLEQGFSVAKAPSGHGPLVIELELSGELEPRRGADGSRIELRRPSGELVAHYSDLWAWDARGEPLAAQMTLEQGRVRLVVDDRGAVYPLEVDPLIWGERTKLLASDRGPEDYFGTEVSLHGDFVLVGSRQAEEDGGPDIGAAYVFVRAALSWSEQAKLSAPDGELNDYFGRSVSLASHTALVGAVNQFHAGAVYVFVRNGTTWSQQAKLTAADGDSIDLFGIAVSLHNEAALVGAPYDEENGNSSGSVYAFVRNAMSWTQQAKLTASDGAEGDEFGSAVSLRSATALVGAFGRDNLFDNAGSAYVFVRSGSAWSQLQQLTASDGAAGDKFGQAVSLNADAALLGANLDDDGGPNAGSAYVFVRSGSTWSELQRLTAADAAAGDRFGNAVSLSGTTAVVGAYLDDEDGDEDVGAAYVFAWGRADGDPCAADVECAKGNCIDELCCGRPCDGLCEACTYDLTGEQDGRCAPILAGDDPQDECPAGQQCDGAGECKNEDGQSCTLAEECLSPYCADGVCCDAACDGECEACTAALNDGGQDGICGPIVADTDPDDECPRDDEYPGSCGADGMCDGAGRCRRFALSDVVCWQPTCADGVATLAGTCNGGGICSWPEMEVCHPYVCGADACKTTCSTDADCVEPYRCDTEGHCGKPDICYDHIVVEPDGDTRDCWPYRCSDDGVCLDRCQSTAECVTGYACDSNGDCIDEHALGLSEGDSGCGCAMPGRPSDSPAALLMGWLALCWAGRRQRQRPR